MLLYCRKKTLLKKKNIYPIHWAQGIRMAPKFIPPSTGTPLDATQARRLPATATLRPSALLAVKLQPERNHGG